MSNSNIDFKWDNVHKFEEHIERQVNEIAIEQVQKYYAVEHISDLTREQIESVTKFADNINEYSPLRSGLYHVLNEWENLSHLHRDK